MITQRMLFFAFGLSLLLAAWAPNAAQAQSMILELDGIVGSSVITAYEGHPHS
jgi:hypothetical protein